MSAPALVAPTSPVRAALSEWVGPVTLDSPGVPAR